MRTVSVLTADLLVKVKANRDSHRALFLKAQEGYRKQVIQELRSGSSDGEGELFLFLLSKERCA